MQSRFDLPLHAASSRFKMPKYTMPMNWHYTGINTVIAQFLMEKSKSVSFGIFYSHHTHQYVGADDGRERWARAKYELAFIKVELLTNWYIKGRGFSLSEYSDIQYEKKQRDRQQEKKRYTVYKYM